MYSTKFKSEAIILGHGYAYARIASYSKSDESLVDMTQRIIAIGGGGFLMEPENPLLDQYFLEKTEKSCPKVCFIPTGSGDSEAFLCSFYSSFSQYSCKSSHLAFFRRYKHGAIPLDNIEQHLLSQDAIYVGGGNTRAMLAVWREWNLPKILKKAWQSGILLGGMSAGALCWFDYGGSDSVFRNRLGVLPGLGFLPGSCVPHYDGELNRRGDFHQLLINGEIPEGIGIDDGAAVLFEGQRIYEVVTSRKTTTAYQVRLEKEQVIETPLLARSL
jgi:dipeptidase E